MSSVALVLNNSYQPLGHVNWQRAVTLTFLGKAEVIEEYDAEIRSSRTSIKVPAVIRLMSNVYIKPSNGTKFSRNNIFARDGFTCQYCQEKFSDKHLTFDHVVPVVQGGKKTWENIVTACKPCNSKKEGRTPEQAKMRLKKRPKKPAWSHVISIVAGIGKTPDKWKEYLYQID